MIFIDRIKAYTQEQAVNTIINISSNLSTDNLIRVTFLGEKLTTDPGIKKAIGTVRRVLNEENSPAKGLMNRVQTYLPKENLHKLFNCFFNNAFFQGNKKRRKFEAENGYTPPFLLIISPTMRCNLNCIGCYASKYPRDEGLTFNDVDKVLNEAKEMGIYFITFLGGEPFVWQPIFDILAKHNDIFFQIYTNGTLMTNEIARKLRELGNAAVVVSIEGFKEDTDARRGIGTYDKIVRTMDILRENNIIFGTSSTVTKKNAEVVYSEEFIEFTLSKGSFGQMYYLYMPVADGDYSLMPTIEQRNKLRESVAVFRKTKPMFFIDFWNDGPYVGGCIAAGRRYCHINSNGDVEPCVYTHFAADNIKNTSLKKALDSDFFREIRKHQPHHYNMLTPCMIIDNPWILRKICKKCNPIPTHEGADLILEREDTKEFLNKYAIELHKFTKPIWMNKYNKGEEDFNNIINDKVYKIKASENNLKEEILYARN